MTTHDTHDPKRAMQTIFAALEQGDGRPFIEAMRDDFGWKISGQGPWGRTWHGKAAVLGDIFKPLFAQFKGCYRNRAAGRACADTAARLRDRRLRQPAVPRSPPAPGRAHMSCAAASRLP